MLKTDSRVIGDHTYHVTALGALKGREVFALLVRLASGGAVGLDLHKLDEKTLGQALFTLAQNLESKDFNYLCDVFAKSTDVELPPDDKGNVRRPKLSDVFDLHFSANYLEMIAWLVFALEVNFASFFQGLAAKLANAASKMQAVRAKTPTA